MKDVDKILFEATYGDNTSIVNRVKYNVSVLSRRCKDKLDETAAILSGKKFATNSSYEGAPRVGQEAVETEPRRWIIEECVPACQILWDKNIYTFMCSDQIDTDAWIELELECLSSENLEILEQIKKEYRCYQYHSGCINISVDGMGKSAQDELVSIANRFKMQDVPSKYATIGLQVLLMECGCYRDVPNPKYVPLEEQLANMTFENWGAPFEEEYIREFDIAKMQKSTEEYIEEYGAVMDYIEGICYVSKFHYDKHLKYLRYLEEKPDVGGKGLK